MASDGMSTSGNNPVAATEPRAARIWTAGRTICVELMDGRTIGFPAGEYRRLRDASDDLLAKVSIEPRGRALRWEELDEGLSIDGILAGRWLP